jgi:hypothetical protein
MFLSCVFEISQNLFAQRLASNSCSLFLTAPNSSVPNRESEDSKNSNQL